MQPLTSHGIFGSKEASVPYIPPIPLTSLIVESDAKRYIDNPHLLKIELPLVFENEGSIDKAAMVLEEIIDKTDPANRVIVAQCIYEAFIIFPTDFQRAFLRGQPLSFIQLMNYWSIEHKKLVLKHLTKELKNWKELLAEVFEILDYREEIRKPEEKLPGRFLMNLIESFSPRRKRQWIKYCSRKMNDNHWAFFVIALKPEDRKLALRVASQNVDFDLLNQGVLSYFEAFAHQIDQHPVEVKTILEALLHQFYRAKKFTVIINQFKNFDLKTQVCLLHAVVPSKQSRLLHHYRDDAFMMAQLFEELFLLQNRFKEQKKVVEQFGEALKDKALSEFVRCLVINGSKAGAHLLVCLPYEVFLNFIYEVDVHVRTQILLKSSFSSTTGELLNFCGLQRKMLIYESMGLMSSDVSIEFYTADNFFKSFEGAVDEHIGNCTNSIICIPPVIIGLVAKMGNHDDLLIKLAPFMNDEQLKFFTAALSEAQFFTFVEKHSLSLGFGKQETLLRGLSTQKLIAYARRKTDDLKEVQKKFHKEYRRLQLALDLIEEGEVLSSTDVKKLEDQAAQLQIWARMPFQSNYHHLCRYLRELNGVDPVQFQAVLDQFQQSMDQLKSKCHDFQRPQGVIVNQLDRLRSVMIVEEEEKAIDLTTILYDGFWAVVRDGALPYLGISPHSQLGITDLNQLTCLGILSDADLRDLGISPELQNQVTNMMLELQKLQIIEQMGPDEEKKSTVLDFWNECTQIKLSEIEVKSKCQEIINLLKHSPRGQFKTGVVNFCLELLKFPCLSLKTKSALRGKCTHYQKSRGKQVLTLGSNLLFKALILLRAQHPLFCLQRYLADNLNLKQTWETLRLNGYSSIHNLFEKELLKNPSDLLRLEEIAKKMSSQCMEIV